MSCQKAVGSVRTPPNPPPPPRGGGGGGWAMQQDHKYKPQSSASWTGCYLVSTCKAWVHATFPATHISAQQEAATRPPRAWVQVWTRGQGRSECSQPRGSRTVGKIPGRQPITPNPHLRGGQAVAVGRLGPQAAGAGHRQSAARFAPLRTSAS